MRPHSFAPVKRSWAQSAAAACLLVCLGAAAQPPAATANANSDFERCRSQANLDACYDAIRYRPSDPSLLFALGDALARANRPVDALRTYRRVAALAPNLPGVAEKISAIEEKMSAKRPSAKPPARATSADASSGKRFSNAAPETQSH
jgi:tetratricopeptide (TPR) repeat protein